MSFIKRTLEYTLGLSTAAGIGNMLRGSATMAPLELLTQGTLNHIPYSIGASALYAWTFERMRSLEHYRLALNLSHASFQIIPLMYHTMAGTENPLETVLPVTIAGFIMVNRQASQEIRKRDGPET